MINKKCFCPSHLFKRMADLKHVVVCIFLLTFLVTNAHAQQQIITGEVVDSGYAPLSSASVVLVDNNGLIMQFAVADQMGRFSISFPKKELSVSAKLWLEVSFVGYKKQRSLLIAQQSAYRFVLSKDPRHLKETVVKSGDPIILSGDTLKYDVAKFAQNMDRSIMDVLSRMPGIDIANDGTIYFNGKKINNLYIDGDDLMSGRYGLATKTIRKEIIESVEVINNHRPIKVLQNKIQSDNTAINLVLKDPNSIKASINGMLGAGLPHQYDAYATAILLNQKFKSLNNIGFNNSGVDYRNDFKQLGSSNFITDVGDKPTDLSLSLGTIAPPPLPLPNYYFNKSGVLNLNNLYKTRDGLQIKLNLQGFTGTDSLKYYSKTENYAQNDTTRYLQHQSYTNNPTSLSASLNLMVNKDKYFFNNNTSIAISHEDNNSFMNFNGDGFDQRLIKHVNKFSNDFNFMPLLKGNGVGEIRWLISYAPNTQLLNIGDGYYSQIPNQIGHFDNVFQHLTVPTLFSNIYISYNIPGKVIYQQYMAGYRVVSQSLTTQLDFAKDGQINAYSGDAGNDLNWRKSDVYVSAEYQFKYHHLKSVIKLPLTYQHINYYETAYSLNSRKNNILFNPVIQLKYDFNTEQNLSASYTFNTTFSDLSGVYRGGILVNYLTFTTNDADLQGKMDHLANVFYNFQRPAGMLFMNAGITYDKTIATAILSTQFLDNIQKKVYLPTNNDQDRISLLAGLSKYIFKLKTTVSVKSQWNLYRYLQIVNNVLVPSNSNSVILNAKIQKKVSRALAFAYEPNAIWSSASQVSADAKSEGTKNSTFGIDQHLSVIVTPIKKGNIELIGRDSYNTQSNNGAVHYFFMDAKSTYSTAKGMDISFVISNLFNIKNYTVYTVLPNHLIVDQYTIRGRMCILRLNYNF